jgi:hypothetical protein
MLWNRLKMVTGVIEICMVLRIEGIIEEQLHKCVFDGLCINDKQTNR